MPACDERASVMLLGWMRQIVRETYSFMCVCVWEGANLWFVTMMFCPDLIRTLTHFQEKGNPCLLSNF